MLLCSVRKKRDKRRAPGTVAARGKWVSGKFGGLGVHTAPVSEKRYGPGRTPNNGFRRAEVIRARESEAKTHLPTYDSKKLDTFLTPNVHKSNK